MRKALSWEPRRGESQRKSSEWNHCIVWGILGTSTCILCGDRDEINIQRKSVGFTCVNILVYVFGA